MVSKLEIIAREIGLFLLVLVIVKITFNLYNYMIILIRIILTAINSFFSKLYIVYDKITIINFNIILNIEIIIIKKDEKIDS